MRVIDLAIKDLRQLVRDWKAGAFLVAMPIVFTLMFGFAFGGFGREEQDPRLPVGFLDQDGEGSLSAALFDLLSNSEVIRPVQLGEEDAGRVEERVREGDLVLAVLVPPGYSARVLAGDIAQVAVIVDEASSAGLTARNEVQVAVARLLGAAQAARLSAQAVAAQAGFVAEAARQAFLQEALARAVAVWSDPPVTVTTRLGAVQGEQPSVMQSGFSHTSPSMMVQFAVAGLIGTGEILVLERKSRALQRLLTTAIFRVEIILGHFLAMFVMIFLQLVLLVGFGQIALHVDYMREPLAVLLVMVAFALWAASLGLLIGTLAKTEEQVVIFSLVAMFVLAGLGGAWVPLEYTGRAFQTIGHLMPTAWAMDGFENIVIRGLGLESVLLPAGILLVYGLAFFGLAAWLFRFE